MPAAPRVASLEHGGNGTGIHPFLQDPKIMVGDRDRSCVDPARHDGHDLQDAPGQEGIGERMQQYWLVREMLLVLTGHSTPAPAFTTWDSSTPLGPPFAQRVGRADHERMGDRQREN